MQSLSYRRDFPHAFATTFALAKAWPILPAVELTNISRDIILPCQPQLICEGISGIILGYSIRNPKGQLTPKLFDPPLVLPERIVQLTFGCLGHKAAANQNKATENCSRNDADSIRTKLHHKNQQIDHCDALLNILNL